MNDAELIVGLGILLLVALAPVFVVLQRTRRFRGNILLISKKRLIILTVILTPVGAILSLIPVIPFSTIFVALGLFFLLRPIEFDRTLQSKESVEIMERIRRLQSDLNLASVHLNTLAASIQASQQEIDIKSATKMQLQHEIEKQLSDVKAWQQLSEEQKALFIQTARKAIRQKSILESTTVLVGTVAVNLLASLIWALMGAPGKQELVNAITRIFK